MSSPWPLEAPNDMPSVLEACLQRMASGEPVQAVVASAPHQERAAVRSLLETAELARTHRPLPDAAFKRRLADVLLEAELDPSDDLATFRSPPAPTRAPRLRRTTFRLAALSLAAVLALGVFATGAGASPRRVLAGLRGAVMHALVITDHWAAPRPAPQAANTPARRAAGLAEERRAIHTAEPEATSPRSRVLSTPERSMAAERRTSRDQAPATRPVADTATPEARSEQVAAAPSPTIARPIDRPVAVPPTPLPVAPTQPAVVVVSPVAETAVASGPAPVIAPAPPATIGGAGIAGEVTFADGSAFPGVLVTAYPVDRHNSAIWQFGVSIRTDEDGRYLIPGLRPGKYKVAAGERGPWATRRWYVDTRIERDAMPVEVEPARIVGGIDMHTRVWPFGDVLIIDPSALPGWLHWLPY